MAKVQKIIDIRDVELKTPVITIQAMTVSGKQMTLAVFRQLPIGVWTADCEPWGYVRYAIKDQGSLWLVFSTHGILKRRLFETEKPSTRQTNQWLNAVAVVEGTDWENKAEGLCDSIQVIEMDAPWRHQWLKKEEVNDYLTEAKKWILWEQKTYEEHLACYKHDGALFDRLPQLFIAV